MISPSRESLSVRLRYMRKIGITTATGGRKRCDRNQNARCLVALPGKRAIEYASDVPITTEATVTAIAMIRLFFRPSQPRIWFSAVEKWTPVGCAGNQTGGVVR